MRTFRLSAAVMLVCALGVEACGLLPGSGSDKGSTTTTTPTSPTPTTPSVTMDAFAGAWASTATSAPPTGCGNVKYTVTPVSSSSANVQFAGTCGGNITVNGAGTGTLSGGSLSWNASGLVSQGGVNCPFTFTNGKATPDSTGGTISVTYSGTVCGIPVSGTETVKK